MNRPFSIAPPPPERSPCATAFHMWARQACTEFERQAAAWRATFWPAANREREAA